MIKLCIPIENWQLKPHLKYIKKGKVSWGKVFSYSLSAVIQNQLFTPGMGST